MNNLTVNAGQISSAAFAGLKQQQPVNEPAKDDTKESNLSGPMEMAGRSMVNFKGLKQLNANDLNFIAEAFSGTRLADGEIRTLKDALIKAINKYRCKDLMSLLKRVKTKDEINDNFEAVIELSNYVQKKMMEINPNSNPDRCKELVDKVI